MRSLLLAAAIMCGSGCGAPVHYLPDQFAAAVYESDLARLIHNACSDESLLGCASGLNCGSEVALDFETLVGEGFDEEEWSSPEPVFEGVALQRPRRPRRPYEVGPPPVTRRPPAPPNFLPVPSRPVFAQGAAFSPSTGISAPTEHDSVEVSFGSQLTFP